MAISYGEEETKKFRMSKTYGMIPEVKNISSFKNYLYDKPINRKTSYTHKQVSWLGFITSGAFPNLVKRFSGMFLVATPYSDGIAADLHRFPF